MTIILLFFFLYSLTSKCAKAYFLFNVSTANFILRIDVIFFTFFIFFRNKFKIPVSYPENRFNTILSCVLDSKNHIRRFVKRFKNVSINTNNLTLTYNLLDIESLFSKMRFPLIERPVNRDFYQGM